MKTTNKSTVDLVDHMGSDLTVVNAARVSFDKESEWVKSYFDYYDVGSHTITPSYEESLGDKDAKLISYLAKHNHWSPFAHTSIQVRVSAPIFVARQLVKHQVGLVWNEVSRRYVDDEPVFYFPDHWRKRAENKKQGSSDEKFWWWPGGFADLEDAIRELVIIYNRAIETGLSPEQARMILPQNMMTSWYWTGSLMAFHRVFKQRTDDHAQKETQEVAQLIGEHCKSIFPVAWEALNGKV